MVGIDTLEQMSRNGLRPKENNMNVQRISLARRGLGVLLICGALVATADADRVYLITDLGTLTDRNSGGSMINEMEQVVGGSAISGGYWELPDGTAYAEAWVPHAFVWTDGVMTDLGTIEPDPAPGVFPRPGAMGVDINNLGQAVGIYDAMSGWPWAFIWLPEPAYGLPAGMSMLPRLAESQELARAFSINDSGQIVGESRPENSVGVRAVRWDCVDGEWQVTDLGSLDGNPEATARAYDINALGQIVGQSNNLPVHNQLEPFLYLPEPAYGLPAGMNAIATFIPSGEGVAINDLGQIAGQTGPMYPWLWLPEPAYGLPAGQNILPEFPIEGELITAVTDINNRGQIVGWVRYEDPIDGMEVRGWLWENGEYTLLDDVIPAASPWRKVMRAYGINDAGQITGEIRGPFEYQDLTMSHAMILTPVLLGDVDGDHDVDLSDLAVLLGNYGMTGAEYSDGDLDGDGVIGLNDLAAMLGAFGSTDG